MKKKKVKKKKKKFKTANRWVDCLRARPLHEGSSGTERLSSTWRETESGG